MSDPSNTPSTAIGIPADIAKGIAFLLLAHLAFTGMDIGMKALSHDLPVVQILFVFFLGFSMVALIRAQRGAGIALALKTERLRLHFLRALLLPLNIGCVVIALGHLPMAETQALGLTFPLMVTALSAPLLGERVGPVRWAAVALGFAGALVIVRPGFAAFDPAVLVILLGASSFALYLILTRMLSRTEPSERLMVFTGLVGLAVLSVPALMLWEMPDARGWRLLALVAVGGVAGHGLVILALAAAPASVLQPFNFAQLLWAAIAGYLVFGDLPDKFTLVGGTIIVSAGLIVWYRERQSKAVPHPLPATGPVS
jgi:drug/metabolite transporter (DMT)-like permease